MFDTWISRRSLLGGAMACLPAARAWALASWYQFAALESSSGARIGVAAIDTGNGRTLFWRESERFLMCSSFKLSLAAAVLARADAGKEKLDRVIRYQKSELLEVSPATSANLATGMRVDALCQAAVIASDNTAANLCWLPWAVRPASPLSGVPWAMKAAVWIASSRCSTCPTAKETPPRLAPCWAI
jgi:hypothetical protein